MTATDTTVATETHEGTVSQVDIKFSVKNGTLQSSIKPAVEVATKGFIKDFETVNLISLVADKHSLNAKSFGGKLAAVLSVSNMTQGDLEYDCEKEGSVTVNANDFVAAISSFPPSENLVITCEGKDVVISRKEDPEEYQTVKISVEEVVVPEISTKVVKEIEIDRSTFLHSYKRIGWGVGWEDHKEQYLYWHLTVTKGGARFVAGSGARFAILNVKSNNLSNSDNKTEFLFHKDQSGIISSVLGMVEEQHIGGDDKVTISQSERDGSAPEQIVLSAGVEKSLQLIIVGFDSTIKYPSMDKFLNPEKPFVIKTRVKDWEWAVKGIQASWNLEAQQRYESNDSSLEPNLKDGYIKFNTVTGLRAQRKVPLEDVIKKESDNNIKFLGNVRYISEIFAKNNKSESVEIKYYDNVARPIVIEGSETDNESLNIKEQLVLLIAPLARNE